VQGVGKVADRPAAGRRKRIPGAARSFFHHLARARSSAPQQGWFPCRARSAGDCVCCCFVLRGGVAGRNRGCYECMVRRGGYSETILLAHQSRTGVWSELPARYRPTVSLTVAGEAAIDRHCSNVFGRIGGFGHERTMRREVTLLLDLAESNTDWKRENASSRKIRGYG
jgi:hypothetical protein